MAKVIQPTTKPKTTQKNGKPGALSKKKANGFKHKSSDTKTKNGVKGKNSVVANKGMQEKKQKKSELTKSDEKYLQEAIDLAIEGVRHKGGPFGSIIVRDGKVIGRGHNQVTKNNDPTAHGEIVAIRDACKKENDFMLKGATIFTSCEPCPMCLAASYWSHIDRIVFACTRKDAANIGFDDDFIYNEIVLPVSQRKIPTMTGLHDKGLVPFNMWRTKDDKIKY